jgi:hypothetical protein
MRPLFREQILQNVAGTTMQKQENKRCIELNNNNNNKIKNVSFFDALVL